MVCTSIHAHADATTSETRVDKYRFVSGWRRHCWLGRRLGCWLRSRLLAFLRCLSRGFFQGSRLSLLLRLVLLGSCYFRVADVIIFYNGARMCTDWRLTKHGRHVDAHLGLEHSGQLLGGLRNKHGHMKHAH